MAGEDVGHGLAGDGGREDVEEFGDAEEVGVGVDVLIIDFGEAWIWV